MDTTEPDFESSYDDFCLSLERADLSFRIQAFSRLATVASPRQKEELELDINTMKRELDSFNRKYLAQKG